MNIVEDQMIRGAKKTIEHAREYLDSLPTVAPQIIARLEREIKGKDFTGIYGSVQMLKGWLKGFPEPKPYTEALSHLPNGLAKQTAESRKLAKQLSALRR